VTVPLPPLADRLLAAQLGRATSQPDVEDLPPRGLRVQKFVHRLDTIGDWDIFMR